MMSTPFFPLWSARLNPLGRRSAKALLQVRALTLCQLESCLDPWLPPDLFPKASKGTNSRDRDYTQRRTFWCMLWQCFHPGASGRAVVRQLQALFHLEGGRPLSEDDGAFCRAKARLPLREFPKALCATAQAADKQAPAMTSLLQGRRLRAADGSTLTLLADTKKNRQAYPPIQCAAADPTSFPMMRFVVLFSMVSGAILAVATGNLKVSELSLSTTLAGQLLQGDILVGDRGFGCYPCARRRKHAVFQPV